MYRHRKIPSPQFTLKGEVELLLSGHEDMHFWLLARRTGYNYTAGVFSWQRVKRSLDNSSASLAGISEAAGSGKRKPPTQPSHPYQLHHHHHQTYFVRMTHIIVTPDQY